MVKIYEALEQAQRERARRNIPPLSEAPPPDCRAHGAFDLTPEWEREMVLLYKNIENILPDMTGKVIQFIGAHENAGSSTVARSFASASTFVFGRKTVLVDAEFPPAVDLEEALEDTSPERTLERVGNTGLYLWKISARAAGSRRGLQASVALKFWELLKRRFDLVVVDSAPVSKSAEGVSLAPTADGVVFVVEAERTRRPVARNGLDAILKAGGNVLGVAFNKRRYYIPESIYRKL